MDTSLNSIIKERVSYAQNREDIVLGYLLYDIKNGYYVDVGANDPVTDSVTKMFYDAGWSGINIEPNPDHITNYRRLRKRDVNLQCAVGSKSGHVVLRQYTNGRHGLSTLSDEVKSESSKAGLEYVEYEVEVKTLENILGKYCNKQIDFLKIDVEGFEYEVITGNDWKKFRPKIIVVEVTHIFHKWEDHLVGQGYIKVFFDGINNYYSSQEYLGSIDTENYAKIATEGIPVVTHQEKLRREHLLHQLEEKHKSRIEKEHQMLLRSQSDYDWAVAHPLRFAATKMYRKYVPRRSK